jgi:hypothetical protein
MIDPAPTDAAALFVNLRLGDRSGGSGKPGGVKGKSSAR